ncbi:hypothetical protein STVIR_7358 [Streptomyces viridochromogenes Tue57]|uniref:Uncharacterized protein n=1 Tax=Streptomyces viridochromogenes Tue57 TaxID=1160705 RepID=L8P6E1_STRVR|nr:hypothetical protein STVIR_7358 [Streptomyces viridochromogenes Tue57]
MVGPVRIDLPGIDPDRAWDDEGDCWCAVSGVRVARIDPAAGKVLEESFRVWSGTGMQHPEAPHLYRVGDWWYLLLAEGGTALGHSSPSPAPAPHAAPANRHPATRSRPTAAPVSPFSAPATPTWSRRPTAPGGCSR